MESSGLYPLKFTPILKEKVWGGTKLSTRFGKKSDSENLGESWELSGVDGNISKVANGALLGQPIDKLITDFKEALVGVSVFEKYGDQFPLLFKFIDATQDLSVQLHPDDALAHKRHNGLGKTEMWYILEAEENARIIVGFNRSVDEKEYVKFLSENKLPSILQNEIVQAGDSFLIKPGTIHAIGAGVVLAEIQQTSDITYRIYDWDRPGVDGKMRQLHTKEAMEAISFEKPEAKLDYTSKENVAVLLKQTPYFETNKLVVSEEITRDFRLLDSFVVYMCVDGEAKIDVVNHSETIERGQTILIPACFHDITISAINATLLEVYIP